MVERMWWANTWPWTRYYQILWLLSYCHAQSCMECDRWIALREEDERKLKAD